MSNNTYFPTNNTYSRLVYTQSAEASDTGVQYKILARFEGIEGDLPPGVSGVFVYRITVDTNPKADVFARVATLADLGKAAVSRDAALVGAQSPVANYGLTSAATTTEKLYLSPEITLTFNDLQVALQAKQVLEQRVDQILLDWKAYRDRFIGMEQTAFPLFSAPAVTAATQRYKDALDARTEANDAVSALTKALADATSASGTAATEYDRVKALSPYVCEPAATLAAFRNGQFQALVTAADGVAPQAANLLTFQTACTTLATAISSATDLADLKDNKLPVFQAAMTSYLTPAVTKFTGASNTSLTTTLANLLAAKPTGFDAPVDQVSLGCTTLTGQASASLAAKNQADSAAAKASADVRSAKAKADAAQKEVAAALAAVLAVCPSFDPSTV